MAEFSSLPSLSASPAGFGQFTKFANMMILWDGDAVGYLVHNNTTSKLDGSHSSVAKCCAIQFILKMLLVFYPAVFIFDQGVFGFCFRTTLVCHPLGSVEKGQKAEGVFGTLKCLAKLCNEFNWILTLFGFLWSLLSWDCCSCSGVHCQRHRECQ